MSTDIKLLAAAYAAVNSGRQASLHRAIMARGLALLSGTDPQKATLEAFYAKE